MKKMNRKGFTIVELVIVIAVIAILAGVLIPTFSNVVEKAQNSAALQEVKNAYTATLADELGTPETTDDVISKINADFHVEAKNGKIITITKDGGAKVAATNETATYKVEDGKIVIICTTHDYENGECKVCGTVCAHIYGEGDTNCTICGKAK